MQKTNIANFILNELTADANLLNNYEYSAKVIDSVVESWSKKHYISPKMYAKQIYLDNRGDKHFV